MIGSLIIALIAAVQFVFPLASYPNILLSVQFNQTDNRQSLLSISNSGTATATNVQLTLQFPSNIVNKTIFSTESYTIKQESEKLLQLSIPRLTNGEGSIMTIKSFVNSNISSKEDYTVYATHDKGSVKISSPDPDIKTEKRQAPSIQEILPVLPISGLLGYFGIRMLQVAFFFKKRKEVKGRTIGSFIVGSVFLLIPSALILATILL
jgi:hypothetical protein